MQARELRPLDVVLVSGYWRLVTQTRSWCGLVTVDLLDATPATWRALDEVQTTSPATEPPPQLHRGEGSILDANSDKITE